MATAAHGYLVDQFFWGQTNKRADRYGGADIASRARFGAEIFREMRPVVGPDFALRMRISQWKTDFYVSWNRIDSSIRSRI
jgi:2,4-dienoyl-CoA reductase-like NADH-dependent reductase (Old Yellow Enzyme family)